MPLTNSRDWFAGSKYASSRLKRTLWISSRKDGKRHAGMSHGLFITFLIMFTSCTNLKPKSMSAQQAEPLGCVEPPQGVSFHLLAYLCRHFGDGASVYLRLYPPPPQIDSAIL